MKTESRRGCPLECRFFVYVFWLVTTVSTSVEVEIYGFVVAVVVVKYKNSLREVFGLRHQLSLFILRLPLQNKKKEYTKLPTLYF